MGRQAAAAPTRTERYRAMRDELDAYTEPRRYPPPIGPNGHHFAWEHEWTDAGAYRRANRIIDLRRNYRTFPDAEDLYTAWKKVDDIAAAALTVWGDQLARARPPATYDELELEWGVGRGTLNRMARLAAATDERHDVELRTVLSQLPDNPLIRGCEIGDIYVERCRSRYLIESLLRELIWEFTFRHEISPKSLAERVNIPLRVIRRYVRSIEFQPESRNVDGGLLVTMLRA